MARIWTRLVVLVPLSVSVPALAQGPGCQRQAGAVCGNGRLASLTTTANDASVSHGGDFTPIKTGVGLRPGDRILLGAKGAKLTLGDACSTTLAPGSLATITRHGTMTCATEFGNNEGGRELADLPNPKRAPAMPDIVDPGTPVPAFDPVVPIAVGAVAAIGTGIGLAVSRGGNDPGFVSAR